MVIYYFLIISTLIIGVFELLKKSEKNKAIVYFFIGLTIILSLRGINCGTDTASYKLYFMKDSMMSFSDIINYYGMERELLFHLFNKLISMLTENFQLYLTIVSILCVIPIMKFYKSNSKNSILTMALFLTVAPFSMYFSGIRQSIAMGIVIFGFRYIENKSPIKYLITMIIAAGFHQSAIFMLVLYPLYFAKITKKWLIFIIPLMVTVFIYKNQIFNLAINLSERYAERYNVITSTGAYSVLILLVLFNIYVFILSDKLKEDEKFIGLRNFMLLSTCIQCFASINPYVMRLNYYILLFIPILMSIVSEKCQERFKQIERLSTVIFVLFFISYFFYNAYFGDDILNVFPYIPYWINYI